MIERYGKRVGVDTDEWTDGLCWMVVGRKEARVKQERK